MNPRIAEILIQLLQRLLTPEGVHGFDPDALASELVEQGYDPDEVRRAMGWLLERVGSEEPVETGAVAQPRSRRILHAAESHHLGPEARALLAELQNGRLMDARETESFIEQALWLNRASLPVEELRRFVNHFMLGRIRLDAGQRNRVVFPSQPTRH
jgi:uncharacterized protein Smg (DUF494 family)